MYLCIIEYNIYNVKVLLKYSIINDVINVYTYYTYAYMCLYHSCISV